MTEYTAILETDGASWSAYVPDLPGCVAAASSEKEVRKLIEEAIVFHIEGLRLDNQPIPLPSIQAITVRMSA